MIIDYFFRSAPTIIILTYSAEITNITNKMKKDQLKYTELQYKTKIH